MKFSTIPIGVWRVVLLCRVFRPLRPRLQASGFPSERRGLPQPSSLEGTHFDVAFESATNQSRWTSCATQAEIHVYHLPVKSTQFAFEPSEKYRWQYFEVTPQSCKVAAQKSTAAIARSSFSTPQKAASDSQRTPRGTYGFDVQHTRLRTANAGSGSTNGLGSGSSSSNGGRGRLTLGGRQTARAATQEQQPGPPPRVKVRASKLAARLRAGLPRKKLIPPPPVPLNGVTIKAAKRRARKEREMGSIVQRPVVITNGTGFEGQLGVSSDKLEEIDRFLFDVGSDTQGADIAPVGRGTNAGYQSPKTVESSAASAQGTATDGPDNLDFVDFQHPREMKAVPAPFVTKSLKQARREIPPWQRKQARRILSAELPRIDKPVWDTSAPRSAEGATLWMNVHSRNNLKKLLDGLDSDYGVTARAKECFVSKVCMSVRSDAAERFARNLAF